jgi:hypothetical protein
MRALQAAIQLALDVHLVLEAPPAPRLGGPVVDLAELLPELIDLRISPRLQLV